MLTLLEPILKKTGLAGFFGAKGRRTISMAVRNLWLHKLRSFLSVLGIIIGTCAVVALMAFGEGSMHEALEDIKKQGATNVIVMTVRPVEEGGGGGASRRSSFSIARYGLTLDDWRRFEATIPNLIATLPVTEFEAKTRQAMGAISVQSRFVATTPRYAVVYKLENLLSAAHHRFISERDERTVDNVVVLGSDIATELFPGEDPFGKMIKIDGKEQALQVIGVLKDRMPNTSGVNIEQFNRDIYVPLSTWREKFGERTTQRSQGSFSAQIVQLSKIILTVNDAGEPEAVRDRVRATADMVRGLLQQYHQKADWDIKVPLDRLEEAERTRDRYRYLLFAIAAISLLVGGIGIMNIMLATVTERTREVGIRRALGAKRGDITLQFLLEAIVQTMIGGLIGVGVGVGIALGAPPLLWEVWQIPAPSKLHIPSIFIAFGFAVLVGVGFGWYPSYRAARLDPIEALRHE